MAIMKIHKYGDPVLRQKSKPVEKFTPELQKLISGMFETLYAAPGVGLASPQVGVPLRVCVIDVCPNGKKDPIVFINPKISKKKGSVKQEEGCLSFPGLFAIVKRPESVKVEAINEKGLPFVIEASGMMARAIQHELDHLDGKMFIDYLSFFKRRALKKVIKERKKSGTW